MAFRQTSPPDVDYNCVGHALDDRRNLWPTGYANWWPRPATEDTIEEFTETLALYQYYPCDSDIQEPNFEKIALYSINNIPTHVARQLTNGKWTSKLSERLDIEHDTLNTMYDFPPELNCHVAYGGATHFFKRSKNWRKNLLRRMLSALRVKSSQGVEITHWLLDGVSRLREK